MVFNNGFAPKTSMTCGHFHHPQTSPFFQAILVLAQIDFVIGTLIPPSEEKKAKGFVGYSIENYKENVWSAYTLDERTGNLHSFFSVFAVYFPSCTGIVAGANLSGDLKDPAGSIPKGTLLAVATTYFSYILYGILSAGEIIFEFNQTSVKRMVWKI